MKCIRPPRVGFCGGRAVERRLEILCKCIVTRLTWSRTTDRRHVSGPDLLQHFFPYFGVTSDLLDVHCVNCEAAGFEAIVMTRHTVLVDESALFGYGRCGWAGQLLSAHCRGRQG